MRSKRGAGGAVFELGPRSIRTAGPSGKATLAVVRADNWFLKAILCLSNCVY